MRTIEFPTFLQMLPDSPNHPLDKQLRDKFRYYFFRFLQRQPCETLLQYLNQHPFWAELFAQNPYRFNALLLTYCDKRFSGAQRATKIIETLNVFEEKMGGDFSRHLLNEKSILLSQLTDEFAIYLNINQIDPFEGYFSINLRNRENQSLYDASFAFLNSTQLLIASIQGPKGEHAPELIKNATKALHGLRPMFLLVMAFRLLAQKWHCELLGIPHKAQGKYRLSARSKIRFNYDEFWQENEGILHNDYWHLPKETARKALTEIPSKKRAMYRKRYEMLDQFEQQIIHFN